MSSRFPSIDSMAKAFGGPVEDLTLTVEGATTAGTTQTYTITAKRIRLGNRVEFFCDFTMTSVGDMVGAVLVRGLGYTNNSGIDIPVTVGKSTGLSIVAGESLNAYIGNGDNFVKLRLFDTTTGESPLLVSELSNTGEMSLSGWYITDDDF